MVVERETFEAKVVDTGEVRVIFPVNLTVFEVTETNRGERVTSVCVVGVLHTQRKSLTSSRNSIKHVAAEDY